MEHSPSGLAHSSVGFADPEEWARTADQACHESNTAVADFYRFGASPAGLH
jgi:hypothetical protein